MLTHLPLRDSGTSKHHAVLGREYLGVSCRCLGEEGELACLCLVSALVIQPVLLCSVLRRFVHATGCGKHLFVICIPHGVFFRKIIIISSIIIILIIINIIIINIIIIIIIIIITIIIIKTTHTLPHMHNHTCSQQRILLREINKQFDWHD